MHRVVYEALLAEIQRGVYRAGDRMPSEAALCKRFLASRITIAKAIHGLQRDHLVTRRPGSGTYVERESRAASLRFGLLIPELGSTEIFEPICRGMMSSPAANGHTLMWGNTAAGGVNSEPAAEELCRQFVTQRVDGIFFAPLEYTAEDSLVNEHIIAEIERARIPVVLLDRTYKCYPERSRFDLVGIDNHRAGFVLTEHLLSHGVQRIVFAHRPGSASTVSARIAGFREALFQAGAAKPGKAGKRLSSEPQGCVVEGDFSDMEFVREMLERSRPDAILCANDLTAARLMRTLISLEVRIPQELRIVGFDNVNYAGFLPVPLTTIQQDCLEIGSAAMSVMLDRIAHPDRPARDLLVDFKLIVRESCGAHAGVAEARKRSRSGPDAEPPAARTDGSA